MPPDRCREPRCGRFIPAGTELCAVHAPREAGGDVLEDGIQALRHLLARLMEEHNLELQAKYIPRATSVALQAARTRHQIGERSHDAFMTFLGSVSDALDKEAARCCRAQTKGRFP
jgi:hypothetical protein